jgi:hypothetical protein
MGRAGWGGAPSVRDLEVVSEKKKGKNPNKNKYFFDG